MSDSLPGGARQSPGAASNTEPLAPESGRGDRVRGLVARKLSFIYTTLNNRS
jgi:hypothetical protein